MADINVTNVTQLRNAWNTCNSGDRILIKTGTYDLGTTRLSNMNSDNVEVIGYKDTLGDLDDLNSTWSPSYGELEWSGVFPNILCGGTSEWPAINLNNDSVMRNIRLRRYGSHISAIRLLNNSAVINCHIAANAPGGGGYNSAVYIEHNALIQGCHIFYTGVTNSWASVVRTRTEDGRSLIIDRCLIEAYASPPHAHIVLAGGAWAATVKPKTLFMANCVLRNRTSGNVDGLITDRPHSTIVNVSNCIFVDFGNAIRMEMNTSATDFMPNRLYNNIFASSDRVLGKSNTGTPRPFFQINSRRIEITSNDTHDSAFNQEYFTITGGTMDEEFINPSAGDYRLRLDSQSFNNANFGNNIGPLLPIANKKKFVTNSHGG